MSDETKSTVSTELDIEASIPEQRPTSSSLVTEAKAPWYILPSIVFSQFAGTSLWFVGNAVLPELAEDMDLNDSALPILTSSVQVGFIVGTLLLAVFNLVDRVLPTHIFFASTLLGAFSTALIPMAVKGMPGMIVLRFLTGMSIAGIYPVGMKVAADWYQKSLGQALGWLLAAVVTGFAFPFLLRQIPQPADLLLYETSLLATLGGILLISTVPSGPYHKAATKFDPSVVAQVFRIPDFRDAAMANFGHIWELFGFWTWFPVVWKAYLKHTETKGFDESLVTFFAFAAGAIGCVVGGYISTHVSSGRVSLFFLVNSSLCCLLSPLVFLVSKPSVAMCFYLYWGAMVVPDAPQIISVAAQAISAEQRGTAMTIINCLAIALSIGSIQLLGVPIPEQYLFLLLAPGPIMACYSLRKYFWKIDKQLD